MAEQKNGGKNRKALIGIVAAVAAVVILVVVPLCVFVECEPAHTHTYGEWTTVKAATCEETGERERACPCGEKQTEAIPAAGHTPEGAVFENEKPATCKEDGSYEAVVYCAVCGEELSRTKMTTTTEHTPSAAVYENEKPAACETDGSCEMVVYCADCGEELSRETVTIPMTSHTGGTATCLEKAICEICGQPYGELAPHTPGTEYGADETNHWRTCSICGIKIDNTIGAHDFDGAQNCSVCNVTNFDYFTPTKLDDGSYAIGLNYAHDLPVGAITLPSSFRGAPITKISNGGFAGLYAIMLGKEWTITEIHISEGITTIADMAFTGTADTAIYIPESVTLIDYQAFANMTGSVIFADFVGWSVQECEMHVGPDTDGNIVIPIGEHIPLQDLSAENVFTYISNTYANYRWTKQTD